MEAKAKNFKGIILPRENAKEASIVNGIEIFPFDTLIEVFEFFSGRSIPNPFSFDLNTMFKNEEGNYLIDLSDVKGQFEVKRALEIAAAGAHNLIMIGLPGSGKTMLAKRLPTILPALSLDEALETTRVHSIAGLLSPDTPIIATRPFRSPHHTASDVAIVGGGPNAKLGEISLAHNGVLFLDEFSKFKRNVLEVLRQPLEDKCVTIARAKMTVKYPCNFMLVAAMNPSPAGSKKEEELYSDYEIQKFLSKISGPILDRIDIHIHVNPVKYSELASKTDSEKSSVIRERVIRARNIQLNRYQGCKGIFSNSNMGTKELREFCKIDSAGENLLKTATNKLGLSARAYDKILKVGRTIADLLGEDNISPAHLGEAIQYRSLDRSAWI